MEGTKSVFRTLISEWLTREIPDANKRDIEIPLDSIKIITIIGPRRSGKTYCIFYLINQLLKNIPKKNTLYINFEDERLLNINVNDLDNIITLYNELANPDANKNIYLFFDEIQNIKHWELYIRRIYDTFHYKIYITGSSSKLLSREFSTSLAGRNLEYIIMPLSFKEYLDFNNKKYSELIGYTDKRGYVLSELNNYFLYGGYPEIVLENNNDVKLKILKSYYNTIFARDMAKHFNISEINVLDSFLKFLISIYSKYFSISKTYNLFKTLGYKISKNKLLEFLFDSEEIFFLFSLKIYNRSESKKFSYQKKIYIIDSGFINALKNEEAIPRIMENNVFLELYKRSLENNTNVAYWKEYGKSNGKEIDFVLYDSMNVLELIQVTFISEKNEIKERETSSLISGSKLLNCHKLTIITWDCEGEIKLKNEKITLIPLWKWLLNFK